MAIELKSYHPLNALGSAEGMTGETATTKPY